MGVEGILLCGEGTGNVACEYGNEISGFMACWKFLDRMMKCSLHKKNVSVEFVVEQSLARGKGPYEVNEKRRHSPCS
jgi:hypothetical protein